MMNRELSKEEIEKLFAFVRSKYVRWVDLQYEIVDHLASAIEEILNNKPKMTFDLALDEVYSKFPITGFSKLVAEKEKAMHSYWSKKYFGFMKSYFKLPKILIAGTLSYIIYCLYMYGGGVGPWVAYFTCLAAVISSLIYRRKKGYLKADKQQFLFKQAFLGMSSGLNSTVIFWPLYMGENILLQGDFSSFQSWVFAIYLAFSILWAHAEAFVFPNMLKKEIETKYGHLNIAYG